MSILVADNFNYKGRKPLDDRLVKKTVAQLKSMSDSIIYTGAIAYAEDTGKFYTYDTNNTVDTITGKWREMSLDGDAYAVPYKRDTTYKKDMLIYKDEALARALKDFTSDNVELTDDDAWDKDIMTTAGNMVVIGNNEVMLKPYEQNTVYYKNDLVFIGSSLARALQDFTSDNTPGNTKELSFAQDIASNHLMLISGGDGEFVMYKTTKTLSRDIDSTTTLVIADLVSTGLSLSDLKVGSLVYDNNGTVGKVSSIDETNNNFVVTTTSTSEINKYMPLAPNTRNYIIISAGNNYNIGEIIATTEPNFYVEITSVGMNGEITSIVPVTQPATATTPITPNGSGTGAVIDTEKIWHVGNNNQWTDLNTILPKNDLPIQLYSKNTEYKKDTLVYLGNKLARVTTDYKSNNSEPNDTDAFRKDIDAGSLVEVTSSTSNMTYSNIVFDGTSDIFNLPTNIDLSKDLIVTINGLNQYKDDDFTVDNTVTPATIKFDTVYDTFDKCKIAYIEK